MNIRRIKSPTIRLLFLTVIGVPSFSNWPISLLTSSDPFHHLAGLLGYLLFLELIIWMSFGLNRLTEWTLAAAVLSVSVVFPQILAIEAYVHLSEWTRGGSNLNRADETFRLVKQFITMMTVIPYGAMVINAFSVNGILQRAYLFSGKRRILVRHTCLILRVAQHIFESFPPLLVVWREEHPGMLIPRSRTDMTGLMSLGSRSKWLVGAAKIWAVAALVFAFEPIPMFCHEIESLHPDQL